MQRLTFRSSLMVATLALVTLVAPTLARADHAMYAGFGGGLVHDFDCCRLHGRIQGEFGIHFDHEDTGFVLAFEAIGTFGPDYAAFTGGVRFGYDIEVHTDHSFQLLLRPSGLVGIGARDYAGSGRGPFGNVTIQPAFDLRFVLANRLIALWIRPVALDFMIWWEHAFRPADAWSVAYQAVGGIDFQF